MREKGREREGGWEIMVADCVFQLENVVHLNILQNNQQ